MDADQLDISNRGLAKLPAPPIASIGEDSLGARECRRAYPPIIANMLEGPQEWSFAKQRVILASVTNDRTFEWAYAYQLPANCASPIRVLPDFSGLGISIPVPLPGEPYAEAWARTVAEFECPYVIDGRTIYTNEVTATLEFVVNDIQNLNVSALAIEAIARQLAADICVPVKKDSSREQVLKADAEVAWERAIADDRNRQPDCYGDYISESIAARHGIC